MNRLATLFWRPGKSGVPKPLPPESEGADWYMRDGIERYRNPKSMTHETRLRQVWARIRDDKTLAANFFVGCARERLDQYVKANPPIVDAYLKVFLATSALADCARLSSILPVKRTLGISARPG